MITYMVQTCHLLNSQVFVKFFLSVTMPETLHYTEFINKYSPKYVRLIFSLYFMTKILFSTFLLPLPTPFSLIQPIPSATQPSSLPTSSLLFSSHSLHLPSLYPKPASEKDPQEFTNIASPIQFPFYNQSYLLLDLTSHSAILTIILLQSLFSIFLIPYR